MATVNPSPIPAVPSLPTERAKKELPPKSYADAAEEGLDNEADTEQQKKKLSNGNGTTKAAGTRRGQSYFASEEGDWMAGSKARNAKKTQRDAPRLRAKKVGGDGETLVEEQFDEQGKRRLTTVKPDDSYGDQLALDKSQIKKPVTNGGGTALVSGRRAGQGWDRSGIRWAPLNVPLKRRLQMATVVLHSLSIALFLSAFFFLAAIPLTWPLLFPYTLYVLFSNAATSGTLSRRSEFCRRLPIWSLFASYFPARLHRSQALPATRKYIFGYHPHGIISHGAFAAFATEALGFSQLFPGITNTLLTLDSNFRIPLYRDWALAMGLASVSRESCENLLSRGGSNGEGMGRAITIVVGGARESLDARPGCLKLVLQRRKGFVKMAARTGADLVPVLAFGENELYDQVRAEEHPLVHRAQLVVKKVMGFTVPLFFARGVFNYDVGLMPFRQPLNVVVGRPITVVQADKPDPDYVDQLHAAYVAELKRLWHEWKGDFAPHMEADLEIIE